MNIRIPNFVVFLVVMSAFAWGWFAWCEWRDQGLKDNYGTIVVTEVNRIRSDRIWIQFKVDGKNKGGPLIDASHGALNGYRIGIAYYGSDEYGAPGVHDDQEGFYVLEGTGTAKIGDAEFKIRPGTGFIAHAGVPHTMKRDPDSSAIKVLWSHGAI